MGHLHRGKYSTLSAYKFIGMRKLLLDDFLQERSMSGHVDEEVDDDGRKLVHENVAHEVTPESGQKLVQPFVFK